MQSGSVLGKERTIVMQAHDVMFKYLRFHVPTHSSQLDKLLNFILEQILWI